MSHEILLLEDDDSLNHSVSLKLKKRATPFTALLPWKKPFAFIKIRTCLLLSAISLYRTEADWISVPKYEGKAMFSFCF